MSAPEVQQKTDTEDVENKPVDTVFKEPLPVQKANVEKEQEAQLKNKFPQLKTGAPSSFLQKRLSKGQKFFDSGDYMMAKAKNKKPAPFGQKLLLPSHEPSEETGHEIPTPETVPARKASLIPSSKPLGLHDCPNS